MRKILSIVGMVIAIIEIAYSFVGDSDTGQFFGIDMNIWVFRLLWLALFGVVFNGFLKESKKPQ
ncbi:hypothetical protein QSV08_16485 [Maribacter sp. BPC-D8]|uniref:hypothetical protein n=1 Tax=unclassified Maribacter TaxID=2615042 RepID=UPI002793A5C2|nr:hypothetical protein [Maribacter sp. BPC-D8]MDP5060558.1 hypothetical protein [Maribacter sp.]WRI28806.1 hypothetical protein QSV08_16485 [Maribacter sp. BPC-D8]